jgi:hypothetical protein
MEEDLIAHTMLSAARSHRNVRRTTGGPLQSTIAGYVQYGDDLTYQKNFAMTRSQLHTASAELDRHGFLTSSTSSNPQKQLPSVFKFAVCMYVVAQGGGGKSLWKPAADAAGLGESTVRGWVEEWGRGVCAIRSVPPAYPHSGLDPRPPTRCHACRQCSERPSGQHQNEQAR